MDLGKLQKKQKKEKSLTQNGNYSKNHRHYLWPPGSGDFCLEIQRNRIVSTMNFVAIGIRRKLRSILDFNTIDIMIFRKMVY